MDIRWEGHRSSEDDFVPQSKYAVKNPRKREIETLNEPSQQSVPEGHRLLTEST